MASNGTVDGEVPMESDSADSQDMEQSGDLQQVLKEKDDKIALLESEVEELIATMQSSHEDVEKPDQTIHVVEEGESLWSISEMYHGHGFEHAEIAGHNEIDDIHHIKVGDSIIIKHWIMAETEDPIVTLTTSVKSSLTQIINLKNTIQERDRSISDLETRNQTLIKQLDSEKASVLSLTEDKKTLQAEVKEQKAAIKSLETNVSKLEEKVTKGADDLKEAKAGIKEQEKIVKGLEKQLEKATKASE